MNSYFLVTSPLVSPEETAIHTFFPILTVPFPKSELCWCWVTAVCHTNVLTELQAIQQSILLNKKKYIYKHHV